MKKILIYVFSLILLSALIILNLFKEQTYLKNMFYMDTYISVEVTSRNKAKALKAIDEIENIAKFIASVDKNIPLHLSRYFPRYNLNNPPTDIENMIKARDIAKKYLNYVYIGNVAGIDNNTYCPNCNEKLLTRGIYNTQTHITNNKCHRCNTDINISL